MLTKLLAVTYEPASLALVCIHTDKIRRDQVYNICLAQQRIGRLEIGWVYSALKLDLINIQPDFRNKGIGTALLKYLLELAAANGRSSLIINTTQSLALLHIAEKLRPNCLCTVKTFYGNKPIRWQKDRLNAKHVYHVNLPVVSKAERTEH
ncbi:putative acyltransferase [Candidatus Termititenax aidoneus]|uniref:Acyltransferase n=1 Tax=Termititenax aidoneus TaxID=2218524 RepID=A0A388TF46_TERA1|nr:putative acyltransferase [Candidatus Termititenax aidoneus]